MQNAASILMRLQHDLSAPTRRDLTTASVNDWTEILRKLLPIMEAYLAKEKTILANRALSDEGKRAELAMAATETIRACRWLGRVVDALSENMARSRTTLFAVTSPESDPLLAYLRAHELRTDLRKLNSTQRSVAYQMAAERNDVETMAALLSAPGGSWVSTEVKERADNERVKRLNPEAYAAFQQTTLVQELVNGLRYHVALWGLHTGVPRSVLIETFGEMGNLEPGQPDAKPRLQGKEWAVAVTQ